MTIAHLADSKVLGNELGSACAQLRSDQHVVGAARQCDPHLDQKASACPGAVSVSIGPRRFPLACAGQIAWSFHMGSSLLEDCSAPEGSAVATRYAPPRPR